jgi:hypothetical protein
MAAPLGWKDFSSGDVLTAADMDGYVMAQIIGVFADATARDAAITSPQEGQHAFLEVRRRIVLLRRVKLDSFSYR